MNTRIQLPVVNFSRDLHMASAGVAAIAGALAAGALITAAVLVFESSSYRAAGERLLKQAGELAAETASLRSKQDLNGPEAAAISALRQRIASLNQLDFGQAPSATQVLSVLEGLLPPAVALQSLDYDRGRGRLDLVAVSASSEDLTAFFDIASRSPFFKAVRLVDKKQAGTSDGGTGLFQARLNISLMTGEPRA